MDVIEADINILKCFSVRAKLQPCRESLLSLLENPETADMDYLRRFFFGRPELARHYLTFALISLRGALQLERIRTRGGASTLAADVTALFLRVVYNPAPKYSLFRLFEALLLPDCRSSVDSNDCDNDSDLRIDWFWTRFSDAFLLAEKEDLPQPLDSLAEKPQLGSTLTLMQQDWARPFAGSAFSVVRRAVLYWERLCQQRVAAAAAAPTAPPAAGAAFGDNTEQPAPPSALESAPIVPLYAKLMCFLQSSGSGKSRLAEEFGLATCPLLSFNVHRSAQTYPRPDGEILALLQQSVPEWVRRKIVKPRRRDWDGRGVYDYSDQRRTKTVWAQVVIVALLLASFEEFERWLLSMPVSMNLRQLAESRCVNFGPDLDIDGWTSDSRMPAQTWFSFGTAARANDLARLWILQLPDPEHDKPHSVTTIGEGPVEHLVAQAEHVVRLLERHARDEAHSPLFAVQFDGIDALLTMGREHDNNSRTSNGEDAVPGHGAGSVGQQHFAALVGVIARLRRLPIWFFFLFSDSRAHVELTWRTSADIVMRARAMGRETGLTERDIESMRTLLFTDFDVDHNDRCLYMASEEDGAESRRQELSKPLREFARPEHMARFGRPLWTAYPGRDSEDQRRYRDDVDPNDESDDGRRGIASTKVVAGLDSSSGYHYDDANGTLGMLSLRLGLVLNSMPRSAEMVTSRAVAQRMNVIQRCVIGNEGDDGPSSDSGDSNDGADAKLARRLAAEDVLIAVAPSEPLLSREAMGHIRSCGWVKALQKAAEALTSHFPGGHPLARPPSDRRSTGALYSRIVLTLTHDRMRSHGSLTTCHWSVRHLSGNNSSRSIHPTLQLGDFLHTLYASADVAADSHDPWCYWRPDHEVAEAAAAAAVIAKALAPLPREVKQAKLNFLQFPGTFGLLDQQPWVDRQHLARSATDMPRLLHELLRRSAALQIPLTPLSWSSQRNAAQEKYKTEETKEEVKGMGEGKGKTDEMKENRGDEGKQAKLQDETNEDNKKQTEKDHDGYNKPEVSDPERPQNVKTGELQADNKTAGEKLKADKQTEVKEEARAPNNEKPQDDKVMREKSEEVTPTDDKSGKVTDADDKTGGDSDSNARRRYSCPISKVIPLYFGPEDAAFDEDDCSALVVVDRLEAQPVSPWQIFGEDFTDAATGAHVPRTPPPPQAPLSAAGHGAALPSSVDPTPMSRLGLPDTAAAPPDALRDGDDASPFSFFRGRRHPLLCLILDMGAGSAPASRPSSPLSQGAESSCSSPSPVQVYVSTRADPHIWVVHSRGRGAGVFRCMESRDGQLDSVMEQYLPYV